MKKKRALSASRIPDDYDTKQLGNMLTVKDPSRQTNTIVFHSGGYQTDNEMLKITPEGFYVRGQLVPQDDKEARIVYNAFREWMTYAALIRKY